MLKRIIHSSESPAGLNAVIFAPEEQPHNESGELPLIVYLHGAGERGANVEHVCRWGMPRLITEGREIPAVILAPQCPAWAVWDNLVREVKMMIDAAAVEYGIKRDRITLTGPSMGGFGTWMMGITYPSYFAGIAPVAGGGMSWRASKLCKTPVFVVHGESDGDVPIIYSRMMIDRVKAASGTAELITLTGLGHGDAIEYAYEHTGLIDWLLAQRRTDFSEVKEVCWELF